MTLSYHPISLPSAILRKLASLLVPLPSQRVIILTTTTQNRSPTQTTLARSRFVDSPTGTTRARNKALRHIKPLKPLLRKLAALQTSTTPHPSTPNHAHSLSLSCLVRALRPSIKLFTIFLFLSAITQTHTLKPLHHTWNKQDMLGDGIKPGPHPHTFRITSTNVSGGLYSMIPAASVPTTEDDETEARKGKKNGKTRKFVPSHKFTAFCKQQSDLDTNLALAQEAGGSNFNASHLSKKYNDKYDTRHAPGHKASFGLSLSADKASTLKIFGGTSDNCGSIQSTFLGADRAKGRRKKLRHNL